MYSYAPMMPRQHQTQWKRVTSTINTLSEGDKQCYKKWLKSKKADVFFSANHKN